MDNVQTSVPGTDQALITPFVPFLPCQDLPTLSVRRFWYLHGLLPYVPTASLYLEENQHKRVISDVVRDSGISRADLVLGQPTCSVTREEVVAQGHLSYNRTRTWTQDS